MDLVNTVYTDCCNSLAVVFTKKIWLFKYFDYKSAVDSNNSRIIMII